MGFLSRTPEIMTLEQLAEYLQVSYQTVYKMVRNKEIRAVKVGRSYRVRKEDVDAYFENSKNDE